MNVRAAVARLNRRWLRDIAIVLGLLGATWILGRSAIVAVSLRFGPDGAPASRAVWLASAGLALAALAYRHRFPFIVLVVALAVTLLHMAGGYPPVAADLCVPIALYSLATASRTAVARTALAVVLAVAAGWSIYVAVRSGQVASSLALPPSLAPKANGPAQAHAALLRAHALEPAVWGGFPVLALLCLAAWFAGRSNASHQAYRLSAEQRTADLELQREHQAQLAVHAERTRIARELHDVVAHGLSVITIQAQSAEVSLERSPDRARQALQAIIGTSRESLAEMRQMLQVLRPATETASYAPQPGLADVPALLAETALAGRKVELQIEGQSRPLPPVLDLSAYRIIQEGLTNALKHAGATAGTTIRVTFGDDAVEVEVTDTGGRSRPAASRGGHGIAGMRERAGLLGGELTTGPLPGGGFRVLARLPLRLTQAPRP